MQFFQNYSYQIIYCDVDKIVDPDVSVSANNGEEFDYIP
jgi:lipopolysaccharide biosynthesis glycosyltransferase